MFANSYWSSDYKTGIDQLCLQSTRSLRQLHELRQLVFNFINYFHSNSQHLNKLAIDNYNLNSQFRPWNESIPKSLSFSSSEQMSLALVESLSSKNLSDQITTSSAMQYYIRFMNQESNNLVKLSSQIDTEILLQITSFIKANEPQINEMIASFKALLSEYDSRFNHLQKLSVDYNECLRLKEFSNQKTSETKLSVPKPSDDTNPPVIAEKNSIESEFNFPLFIATIQIKDISELSDLMDTLIRNTPTTKRTIPIPGYSNDIFVSNDLCNYLIKYRPFGINPSIANLEKFGQSLIDLKLISGTGFWSKKFKKEDMWFQWSELAVYISEYSEESADNSEIKPMSEIEETALRVNDVAKSTSKRLNTMFQNVRTSLKKYSPDMLPDIEEQYNDEYLELQRTRHLLDLEIVNKSQAMEKFETVKIEIIYQSLTRLLEILYNSSLTSTNKLHVLASDFIEKINKPDNYKRDFEQLLENFSTGIYFPSNIPPENLIKKQFNTIQTNNAFQNIKSQFNLFKDIPLQLQLHTTENTLQSLSSLPIFFYELVNLIDEKKSAKASEYWAAPINHQHYWEVKELTIDTINSFELENHLELPQETVVHKEILSKVLVSLKDVSEDKLINFLKNWLLQTTDSLIPCMVYDSIIKIYQNYVQENLLDIALRQSNLLKQLSTISRSNLSSLVYVLEYIATIFDLTPIETYRKSDEISDINGSTDPEKLSVCIKSLNSMDFLGSIPFIHLILRPSPTKSSSGFKPPIEEYNLILSDLLVIETRNKLLESLLKHESLYRAKMERERAGIQIKKMPTPPVSGPVGTEKVDNVSEKAEISIPKQDVNLKSPRPVSSDSFTLRPFRTKVSPAPSPSPSRVPSPSHTPYHTPNNSLDTFAHQLNIRETTPPVKKRSNSNGLAPAIEVEFEK